MNLMQSFCVIGLRAAASGAACAAVFGMLSGPAMAAVVPFSAVVDGTSTIVDVLNPTGPEVRVQTLATGSGTPGVLTYHSGDVINLGTGQGSGSNRFVDAAGDELRGSFTVQMVPGADPSLFDLVGAMVVQGGSGSFLGASGSVSFLGSGQFFSATQARTRFVFTGTLNTVAEPPTAALLATALVGMLALRQRRPSALRSGVPQVVFFSQASANRTQ